MNPKHKKMLIVGGGYADIPLILSAKKLGYHVITTGNRPNELGHLYSDEYHQADFSEIKAMLTLSEQLKISAICACCNDFSALSSAYVAEKLGLPGHDSYEIAKIIHHKDLYRQFALENAISSPIAMGFANIKEALNRIESLSFPLIIKPVDLTGGKGISIINYIAQAKPALEKAFSASPAKRIVVEEFISGSRHGFSAFLHNGHIIFFFSDNEHYFKNPYLVSAASTPSIVSSTIEKKLCLESDKIASLLSLKTGIFHVQYILRKGKPVIIEICRRAPGDLYIKLVEHATGVLYPDWIVKASAGLDCNGLSHVEPKGFFTRHCVMSAKHGRIKNIIYDSFIKKNIIDQFMWWKKGDYVSDVMTSKFGIVFLQFDSMEEMLTKTERMQELIYVEVE
ncbi:MAG: phosphoribosylglycinamide synthetase [Candidatus Parabeggiatoa sp. nov. 3]|nr:MAG: phosphoribosylglycinamide synthetase [Gammaproteobacteria bacterium]RKZ66635.1 MAG: phosphoribosylglycinamide synthetase [Gammaproteobacteria bacterium]RKZ90087.1 MAG: phosphoribosylglycinamide synthetase [Gammaproteobacteria bacterium]